MKQEKTMQAEVKTNYTPRGERIAGRVIGGPGNETHNIIRSFLL